MSTAGPQPEVAAAEGEIKHALHSGTAREAKALPPHLQNLAEKNQAQTVVQVVGIVLVVTRHLFPEDKPWS